MQKANNLYEQGTLEEQIDTIPITKGRITSVNSSNNLIFVKPGNGSTLIDSVYLDGYRTFCDPPIPATMGETIELNPTVCPGLTFAPNQTVVVTGSNNFSATGKS
ncbi:MAG: hypothetical protein GOV15_00090 [Candidatus Diapherotrites archaeon]|nr:hypothetical protein [Candidatus Diapherotrites archaeon]